MQRVPPLLLILTASVLAGCGDGPTAGAPDEPSPAAVAERLVEVTLGTEYGEQDGRVHLWTRDIRVQVHGSPTEADRKTLRAVVADLNDLLESVTVELVEANPNVDLHFAAPSEFASLEPNYPEGNLGFVWVLWDEAGAIYYARVLISTEKLVQRERSHMIREELTQMLGLLKDSPSDPESIFFDRRSVTTAYTALDRAVVRALYLGSIRPDMNRAELTEALNPR